MSAPGEPPERSSLDEEECLANDYDPELAVPISNDSAGERQQKNRKASRRGDDADEKRAVGQLERQPSLPHLLHPRSDEGDSLARPKQSEVPVELERSERIDRSCTRARRRGAGVSHSALIIHAACPNCMFESCASIPTRNSARKLLMRSIFRRCSTSSRIFCCNRDLRADRASIPTSTISIRNPIDRSKRYVRRSSMR